MVFNATFNNISVISWRLRYINSTINKYNHDLNIMIAFTESY